MTSPRRSSTPLIGTGVFLYWAAMYLYVPVLPLYARSLGASLSMVGIILATYALPQVLLRIPIGIWSDNLGRRKPLVIAGMALVSLGAVGMVLAPDPGLLAVARGVVGAGASVWVVVTIYFVASFPKGDTSAAIGVVNFISNGAMLAATLAGGAIAENWGAPFTFYGAAVLGVAAIVAVSLTGEPGLSRREAMSWGGFTRLATRPQLVLVCLMGMLVVFIQFSGVFGFTPVYASSIGASETEVGLVTMLAVAASMLGALAITHLIRRLGYALTIVTAAVLLGLALVALPSVRSVLVMDVVQFLNGLGRGILAATLMALSIHGVAPEHRATAMGLFQATYAVGMLLGPLSSGYLADSFGLAFIFYVSAALSFVIAGMACLPVLPARGTRSAQPPPPTS